MDEKEKQLTDAYNKAVEDLRKLPKSDPSSIRAAARVVEAARVLRKYKGRKKGSQ